MERDARTINALIVSSHGLRANRPDGVTNVIRQSKNYLEERGIKIKLVGPDIPDKKNNLADRTLGKRVNISINNTRFEASILYNRGKAKAKKLLLEENPDLVIMHQLVAGNVAHALITGDKEGKTCFVGYFHAQSEDLDVPTKALYLASHLFRRPTFDASRRPIKLTPGFRNTINKGLDGRVAVSMAVANLWNQYLPGDYEVIYNGIDTDRFTPEGPIIEEWKKDGNGKRIIFAAARFDERKRLDDFLRAFYILYYEYKMKNILGKIAGDGKMKKELLALRRQLGLNDVVKFVGVLPDEDVPKAYRTADVFISPVEGREGFGLTLAEAMASGTPVVGSNVVGYNEVIGGDLPFAWMTNPRDPRDVAEKTKIVLELSPEERVNRGKLASEYVKSRFSASKTADHQVSYFKRCLALRSSKVAERRPQAKLQSSGTIYSEK
ncbi:MAG: glycosyltransferase family 4 protein [Patescibacteria group bacterium]